MLVSDRWADDQYFTSQKLKQRFSESSKHICLENFSDELWRNLPTIIWQYANLTQLAGVKRIDKQTGNYLLSQSCPCQNCARFLDEQHLLHPVDDSLEARLWSVHILIIIFIRFIFIIIVNLGKGSKKNSKKKLTNVSFVCVCVAGNGQMLVFFGIFFSQL